ncbi:MAG: Holliday junction branch migration protein RuvA [Lachnospiraceae bacterium]|nr:Holliday junction branch migration protein RuvA [Lachnospiraceae bacterium]
MISYIKGELVNIKNDSIVVDNNGIGYNIFIPTSILASLPHCGSEVKIHTYFLVREDTQSLYGFLKPDDLEIFKLLISVSGIGPKGALAILSTLTPDELRFAILSDDSKAISKAPGVGSKTAQRCIIELKDKINIADTSDASIVIESGSADDSSVKNEAISALVALGYTQSEAYKVVSSVVTEDSTVEDVLKQALKKLI